MKPSGEAIAIAVASLRSSPSLITLHPDFERDDVMEIIGGCLNPLTPVIDVTALWDDLEKHFYSTGDRLGRDFTPADLWDVALPPWKFCIMGWSPSAIVSEKVTCTINGVEHPVQCLLQFVRSEQRQGQIMESGEMVDGWATEVLAAMRLYDGTVHFTDNWIERLVDKTGRWQGSVVWHGEHVMADMIPHHVFNFMNCRNVTLVEPARERMTRRRIARTGVTVTELVVTPTGSYRSAEGREKSVPVGSMPLTSVRGHFAHYGPDWGRGLLFGRIAGRFWIPQYLKGDPVDGVTEQHFDPEPET